MYGNVNSSEDRLRVAIDLIDAGVALLDAGRDETDEWLRDLMLAGAAECFSLARMMVVAARERVSKKVSDAGKPADGVRHP